MTSTELILNMLAEASTKDITEVTEPPNAGGTQSGRTARWHDRPQCPTGTRSQNRQKVVSRLNAKQVLAAKNAEQIEMSKMKNKSL